ncbi:MAG: helix-turn-helix domain-containing protein, partial [Ktedonobacteraceae bacterium]
MAEEKVYLRIPGRVQIKEAATILGVSSDSVHRYIKQGRLHAEKIDGRYMIPEQEVTHFQSNPRGRLRTEPANWRAYRAGAKVRAMHIEIQVQPNQQAALQVKLQTALDAQEHLFPGTMQRYIFVHSDNPDAITIQLIWKDTELPDETTLQRDLETFRAEFADLLDWQTARYTTMQ